MSADDSNAAGRLAGQVALVTGASRGIGRAVALAYAKAGAHVMCAARSTDELIDLVAQVDGFGGHATAVELDVTVDDPVQAAFSRVSTVAPGLDIAVLNAGIMPPTVPVIEGTTQEWRDTFDVNVFGVAACARASVPLLVSRGGGKIVIMGSGTARQANPGLGVYGASKAAVAALSRTLSVELRSDNIAVNELVPGPVATSMTAPTPEAQRLFAQMIESGGDWMKQPEDLTEIALMLAGFPNHGPSGQVFSLMGRVM